jgi:UDP-2-acetamido-2,6-beta-L-arabino-hexul-4-ose reductase
MKIGITGAEGFIGSHLAAACRRRGWQVFAGGREIFADNDHLADFIRQCDRIVHFAGLSRHPDGEYLYRTNMELIAMLDRALQTNPRPLFFASTTHDVLKDLPYHRSKRDGRALLESSGRYPVVTLRMANVFGPGSKPFYNSVVSTFCRIAADGGTPEKVDNVMLELIYIDELTEILCHHLAEFAPESGAVTIEARHTLSLPDLWQKLAAWRGNRPVELTELNALLYRTLESYRNSCK